MQNRWVRFLLRRLAVPLSQRLLHPALAPWPRRIGRWLGFHPLPPRAVRRQTAAWAAEAAGAEPRCVSVAPTETLQYAPPDSLGADPDWRMAHQFQGSNPPLFLAILPAGRVVGQNGAVVTADDVLLGDLSPEWFFEPEQHPLFFRFRLPPLKPLRGRVVNLARLSGWNYAHWIMDVLPRLGILERAGIDWDGLDGYIVNGPPNGFKTETLDRLGIPRDKVYYADATSHYQCETLLAPSLAGNPNQVSPWVVAFLRNHFACGLQPPAQPARIYVSRRKADFRRLVNEAEIEGWFKQQGFQSVLCEDLSFQHKVELFFSADVVVAAHGAGLTHLAFCRPGTQVLEFFAPGYVNNVFWALSGAAQLRYGYLVGEGPRPPFGQDPRAVEQDIRMDLKRVENAWRQLSCCRTGVGC
jgi:capsular polysaccharide biosynthesis protein